MQSTMWGSVFVIQCGEIPLNFKYGPLKDNNVASREIILLKPTKRDPCM